MPPSGGEYILRYLSGTEVEQAKKLGFGGYPAFRPDQTERRRYRPALSNVRFLSLVKILWRAFWSLLDRTKNFSISE
jgi:hypothetical protein